MTSQILRLSDGSVTKLLRSGSGQPLLLLHGVGLRAEAWGPQSAALSAEWLTLAADLPGHGGTDALPPGARLADFVGWAARLIQALNLGPMNVAGHSMGALIAAGLAVDHPNLVRRLALLNGVHRRSAEARSAVMARADDIAAGQVSPDGPLARWFTPDQAEVRTLVAGWLTSVNPQGYAAAYRAFAEGDADYADRLNQIRCPVLVLTGAEDANSTPEMTQAMASMAPLGKAEVIAGHRHMVNLTAPETVTRALARWLATEEVAA